MIDLPSGARDGIERDRLPADDRRLGGEQPALGLVDGARDTVETRRHVDDRAAGEPLGLGAAPARRLVEREVDLHLGAAVAESRRRVGDGGRHVRAAEQRAVELGRRHARDNGARRGDDLAVGEADAGRAAVRDENLLHVSLEAHLAAGVGDDPGQRVDEPDAAANRHRHPAELQRGGDHLRHEAGRRLIRPEPRVQDPRREHAVSAPPTRTSS